MAKKVRSVRVPLELCELDLSALVGECEKHLRDLESAGLLLAQGNRDAAAALVKARRADLGRRVGTLVWEARLRHQERSRAGQAPKAPPGE
jgi:hypothetical protein